MEKILAKKPLSLKNENAQKLARFLIEPRNQPEIEFNELAEEKLSKILESLDKLIPTYKLIGEEEQQSYAESIANKFAEKNIDLQDLAKESQPISYGDFVDLFNEANIGLTEEELDFMALLMYRESKDLKNLSIQVVLQNFTNQSKSSEKKKKVKKKEKEKLKRKMMMRKVKRKMTMRMLKKKLKKKVKKKQKKKQKKKRKKKQKRGNQNLAKKK